MYKKCNVKLDNGFVLNYELNGFRDTQHWAEALSVRTIDSLCRTDTNECHGWATPEMVAIKQARLEDLCYIFGLKFEGCDQESLNRLHTNFPENVHKSSVRSIKMLWHEFNTTIHWLEYELNNQQIINADFNHSDYIQINIQNPENFSPYLDFGTLHAHYIYIGRHFLEMSDARDYVSPIEHFKPQNHINATFGMCFSDSRDHSIIDKEMRDYYNTRNDFPYDFDSVSMRKGFLQLGNLVTNLSNSQVRECVKNTKIAGFELIK